MPFLAQMKSSVVAVGLGVGVWASALIGVVLKLALLGRFDRIAVALCLLLGWSGVELAAGRRGNVGRGENEEGGANFAFVEPEPEYGPVPFCRHSACTIR